MPGLHRLTPRENDVLGAMADGLSNDAIARKLHLAGKTIESVIRSIFIKLDISGSPDENRRVLAVRAFLDAPRGGGAIGRLPQRLGEYINESTVVSSAAAAVATGRLLTLTGPGGVGKTRLAIEVARSVERAWADGVWFLDLSVVRDRVGVVSVAAAALGAPANPRGDALGAVIGWCSGRDALIVIDNCEHVLSAAAELVNAVLAQCPGLAVIATSRQPLGCAGERTFPVASLDPTTRGVELLQHCAQRTVLERDVLERIAIAVDGLPLALLLAGSRLSTLPPEAVEAQLRDQLHLRNRDASGPARHLTLAAAFDWSYRLLPDESRVAFARCAVFAGGFDLRAFEAVAGSAELLSMLVDSSLIGVDRAAVGTAWRYSVSETGRRFAEERLGAHIDAVRRVYLAHFRGRAAEWLQRWPSAQHAEVDAAFDIEWANLRAATVFAIEAGDVAAVDDIIGGSFPFAQHRVRDEHREWSAGACVLGVAGPATFAAAANWALLEGDFGGAATYAQRGIAACPSVDADEAVLPVQRLAFALVSLGRRVEAVALVPRLCAAAANHPDPFVRWSTLLLLANGRLALDNEHMVEHLAALAELTAQLSSPVLQARCALLLVQLDLMQGESFESVAVRVERDIAPLARAAGSPETEGWCLSTIAMLRAATGDDSSLRATIERLHELRYWAMLWMTADLALAAFVRRGDYRAAGCLLGFLDRDGHPDTDPFSPRPEVRAMLAEQAESGVWVAEGVGWDSQQAVAFLLAHC